MRRLFSAAAVAVAVLATKVGTLWVTVAGSGCCPPGCPLCRG
jgi:hypothetical protein